VKLRQFRLCFVTSALWLGGTVQLSAQMQTPEAKTPGEGHLETTYRGGLVTPPMPKPKFTLTDTSGTPFDFWSETRGYVTILVFGYTHCPDVCPMHMAVVASALRTLPADVANQVKVVFVTTDPKRDNPRLVRTWLNHFDKRIIGLTGDENAIQAAQIAANVPIGNSAPSYEHSAFVLAYTKDNLAHVIYPSGIQQSDWIHDLPQLVKENWAR
jgi:protein SCO1